MFWSRVVCDTSSVSFPGAAAVCRSEPSVGAAANRSDVESWPWVHEDEEWRTGFRDERDRSREAEKRALGCRGSGLPEDDDDVGGVTRELLFLCLGKVSAEDEEKANTWLRRDGDEGSSPESSSSSSGLDLRTEGGREESEAIGKNSYRSAHLPYRLGSVYSYWVSSSSPGHVRDECHNVIILQAWPSQKRNLPPK